MGQNRTAQSQKQNFVIDSGLIQSRSCCQMRPIPRTIHVHQIAYEAHTKYTLDDILPANFTTRTRFSADTITEAPGNHPEVDCMQPDTRKDSLADEHKSSQVQGDSTAAESKMTMTDIPSASRQMISAMNLNNESRKFACITRTEEQQSPTQQHQQRYSKTHNNHTTQNTNNRTC